MEQDIRWKQRLANYEKALNQLLSAIETHGENPIDIIKEGVIQRFEFTHELAWKTMKDFLEYEGYQNIVGSRSAVKEAFSKGLIDDADIWLEMIESRNRTVHAYQEDILREEFQKIVSSYKTALAKFLSAMKARE